MPLQQNIIRLLVGFLQGSGRVPIGFQQGSSKTSRVAVLFQQDSRRVPARL